MTVLVYSLKCSGSQSQQKEKKLVMFELKVALVYHAWHFSLIQTGQLLHIESNNEKNATLFFFPPKSRELDANICRISGTVKTRAEISQ